MALYVDKQGTPNVLSYSAVQMIGVTKYAYVKNEPEQGDGKHDGDVLSGIARP